MLDGNFNVNETLRDIENFLRNNIMFILKNKYEDDWLNHLGVTKERIAEWESKMQTEKKRLRGNVIENRILYYSDFYDLKTIILNNWDIFKKCFNERKVIEYQLSQLESFRNPNAHNRDLLDYQKCLLMGYIGEIKSSVMSYRGDIEKKNTYFPELESVNVNGKVRNSKVMVILPELYRSGEALEVTVYVTAPNTQKIFYKLDDSKWVEDNHFIISIDGSQYGKLKNTIFFKSDAKYHMNSQLKCDGFIDIVYTVVPDEE